MGDPAVVEELAHGAREVHDDVHVGQHARQRTPGERSPTQGAATERLSDRGPEKAMGGRIHAANHASALDSGGSEAYT